MMNSRNNGNNKLAIIIVCEPLHINTLKTTQTHMPLGKYSRHVKLKMEHTDNTDI